jgi:hypothetical protein
VESDGEMDEGEADVEGGRAVQQDDFVAGERSGDVSTARQESLNGIQVVFNDTIDCVEPQPVSLTLQLTNPPLLILDRVFLDDALVVLWKVLEVVFGSVYRRRSPTRKVLIVVVNVLGFVGDDLRCSVGRLFPRGTHYAFRGSGIVFVCTGLGEEFRFIFRLKLETRELTRHCHFASESASTFDVFDDEASGLRSGLDPRISSLFTLSISETSSELGRSELETNCPSSLTSIDDFTGVDGLRLKHEAINRLLIMSEVGKKRKFSYLRISTSVFLLLHMMHRIDLLKFKYVHLSQTHFFDDSFFSMTNFKLKLCFYP